MSAWTDHLRRHDRERRGRADPKRAVMIRIGVTLAAFGVALAAAQPVPFRGGSCPHGYSRSGQTCLPREGAQEAIPLPPNRTCPWGYIRSGDACLRSGR